MADLMRNLDTETVHRPICPYQGHNAKPWRYADGRSMASITSDTARYPWLHLCRRCLPGACRCQRCGGGS